MKQHIVKATRKIRHRLKENDSLYLFAEVGLATLAVSAPPVAMIAFVIKAIQEKNRHASTAKIRNSFYSLKRRGLLTVESRNGKTVMSLTPEAQRLIQYRQLRSRFELKKKQRWNGKWFMVLFDIHNRHTPARNALRTLLRKFGFAYVQKSAWLYPYDCRLELDFLKTFFRLSDAELRVLECASVGDDTSFKKHFGLK